MTGGLEGVALSAGMKSAAPIVASAIAQAVQQLRNASGKISERVARELRLGYSDFLTASYNRCQQVKTLVSGDQPLPLLDVYVNLDLSCAGEVINDIDLVNDIEKYQRIVISGTGGAGKSMLMKYLTICRFENPRGKIPLFVELRNLNSLTTKDLLQYCFSSCSTSQQKVTFNSFEKVFSSGGFILILDGFDEIESEHRDEIERQIISIGRRHPDSTIIVSSRGDSRFKGWQDYYVFEVNKLQEEQVKSLISKAVFDSGIKRRFLKEISSLWKTHETFLSIPLLSIIMLITFGKFSEISPKATLFYKLAFQTLFREHDASKEQFKRPIYSALDLNDFERSFAAFCAISYLDNKISFSEDLALKFASQAAKYARVEFNPKSYIRDLNENICLLQMEGTEYTFIHRSFQEYFTALFLVGYHESNLFDVIDRVSSRESDSTLAMLKELDESKFELAWLLPVLEGYISELSTEIESGSSSKALKWIFSAAVYDRDNQFDGLLVSVRGRSATIRNISRIYPDFEDKLSMGGIFFAFRTDNVLEVLNSTGSINNRRTAAHFRLDGKKKSSSYTGAYEFHSEDDVWLKEIGILDQMTIIRDGFEALKNKVLSDRKKQEGVIRV